MVRAEGLPPSPHTVALTIRYLFLFGDSPNQEVSYMVAFKQDIWSMLFCVMHATFMSNNINFSNVFCIHKMKFNVDLNIRLLSNVNFSLLFFPLHCLTFSRHLYLLSHLLLTHIKVFKNALFTLPTLSSKHLHRALLLTVPPPHK